MKSKVPFGLWGEVLSKLQLLGVCSFARRGVYALCA